jgi:ATP-GRASP peptide maturase of grasp-with-spasm system
MINNSRNLIFSISSDNTTNDVLDWVFNNNVPLHFNDNINIDAVSYIITNDLEKVVLRQKNQIVLDTKVLNSMWYRRGQLIFTYLKNKNKSFGNANALYINNKRENDYINIAIESFLHRKFNTINKANDNFINKINVLSKAHEIKILVPPTIITNEVNEIIKFVAKYGNGFVKDIEFNTIRLAHLNKYVIEINLANNNKFFGIDDLKNIKSEYPFMFQSYIPKKYEIRTFYLKGQFRSMAIFSQQNEKTKTDFRNYDNDRPNRNVPYNLPKSLEKKLHKLMLKLDINCGSMDIIVTPDDEYYFLEVNPIGQFQWLSKGCNYFIERMIAEDLAN